MRYPMFVLTLMMGMMAFSTIFVIDAEGAPAITNVTYLPLEPTVEDDMEFTVDIALDGETVDKVSVQFCIDPVCYDTILLTDDGSGTTWSGTYPHDNFQNTTGRFNITVKLIGGSYLYHEFYINFTGIPDELILDPIELHGTTIYPNQTISATGRALYDLGHPPEDLALNLSIAELDLYETAIGDEEGNFSLSLTVPVEGTYTVNLTATDGNLSAYREWEILVNRWPIPRIILEAGVDWDPPEAPPGSVGTVFYTSSNITIDYLVSNKGTGLASNVTVNLSIVNDTTADIVHVGDLLINNSYEGSKVFNIDTPGNYMIVVTVSWDQVAPKEENITDPVWTYPFTIVERPVWEKHTPLVELFTSTTCEYCVAAEEAIERLMHKGEVEFTAISYILDDDTSDAVGEARGVIGTPMVKIDHEFISLDSVEGEEPRVELWETTITKAVNDAARRDTPPVNLNFSLDGVDWIIDIEYSPLARDNVSGTLNVYLIEEVSDLRRNHQNYPMAYRYMDSIMIEDLPVISPGMLENLSVGETPQGFGLVAVLYDQYMNVIQTRSVFPHTSPALYMERGTIVHKAESPGTSTFPVILETFPHEGGALSDLTYMMTADDVPLGWSVRIGEKDIALEPYEGVLIHANSDHEILPDGRNRYFDDVKITLEVPINITGYSSLSIILTVDWQVMEKGVLVETYINDTDDQKNETTIEKVWLGSEGMNLFLFAEVKDLPDGGIVKGWVQPCMEGDSGYRGAPIDIIMVEDTPGIFKGTVQGIDLDTFSHLTYRVKIVMDGLDLVVSEEVKDPISDYITITPADDEGGDDESPWALIGATIVAISVIILIVILMTVRSRGGSGTEQALPGDHDEERTISTEELDAMIQDFPIPPMPLTHHPVAQKPSEKGEDTAPPEDASGIDENKPEEEGHIPTVEEGQQQEPPTTEVGKGGAPSEGESGSITPVSEDTTQIPIPNAEGTTGSDESPEAGTDPAQGPIAEQAPPDQF